MPNARSRPHRCPASRQKLYAKREVEAPPGPASRQKLYAKREVEAPRGPASRPGLERSPNSFDHLEALRVSAFKILK